MQVATELLSTVPFILDFLLPGLCISTADSFHSGDLGTFPTWICPVVTGCSAMLP